MKQVVCGDRLKIARRRVIAKKIIIGLTVLLVLSWISFALARRTVTRSVEYNPCEITYGKVIGEWEGDGKDAWNEQDYHYQVREFSMLAHAPGFRLGSVIEENPKVIATGGEHACLDGFSESIDTKVEDYRWKGAQTVAIRLGAPNLGGINNDAKYMPGRDTELDASLTPPVFSKNYGHASVWVDDGARASLIVNGQAKQLWCQGFSNCGDITKAPAGKKPLKGAGYLFVSDNCPAELPCDGATSWYGDLDYSKAVGKKLDYLKPFKLRLEAVSTYAPTVGTKMFLTFKYPAKATLKTEITANGTALEAGDEIKASITIQKNGPTLEKLSVSPDITQQPLTYNQTNISEEQLALANKDGIIKVVLTFKVAEIAKLGACYKLPINITALYAKSETKKQAILNYCMKMPGITYTYSVATKGNTTSDLGEFKRLSAETLAHARGWAAADIAFRQVAGGGDFTLWLSAPNQMTSFSSGCDSTYSCQVGRNVIINDSRWQNATPAWNKAGGSLRDYRHMVINHEVGHFLGFGHYNCPKPGAPAPVMQQQSIDLQGCKFNPWPTLTELSRL